jgi:hypothetical protein
MGNGSAKSASMVGDDGVCQNQDKFNGAFYEAIKYARKKDSDPHWAMGVVLAIYLLVIVWALLLASTMPQGELKVMHYVMALVFAPFYIISFYAGK